MSTAVAIPASLKRTCEQCTKSKVRCSGPETGTCTRCAARGTECFFRSKYKRGPPPSTSRSNIHDKETYSKRSKAHGSTPSRKRRPKDDDDEDEDDEDEDYDEDQIEDEEDDEGQTSHGSVDVATGEGDSLLSATKPTNSVVEDQALPAGSDNAASPNIPDASLMLTRSLSVGSQGDVPPHPPGITWHERRCWNVFFATFKHQNRKENPMAWCWFAVQLEKLRNDLEKIGNVQALARLEKWMNNNVHTKMSTFSQKTIKQCTFAPQLCTGCSSLAMSSKPAPSRSAAIVANQQPSNSSVASINFFHPRLFPFIEFEMDAQSERIVGMNELFSAKFGHTKESLDSTMSWAKGGGFLPWGGDLLARLLWSEADVLVYLQVLAVKFQTLGPPKHDHNDPTHVQVREVMSAYVFDVRVASSAVDGGKSSTPGPLKPCEEYVLPCMVKALHRETIVGPELKVTLLLEFEPMGVVAKPGSSNVPECSRESVMMGSALMSSPAMSKVQSDASAVESEPQSEMTPLSTVVPPTPQDDLALLDPSWNWQTFEGLLDDQQQQQQAPLSPLLTLDAVTAAALPLADSSLPSSSSSGCINNSSSGCNNNVIRSISGPATDEFWLASVLDWTS